MASRRLLILWGCHRAHGNEPLKLCEWTAKAQRERERLGWLCAAYLDGDEPKGLKMLWANTAARAEGEAAPHA